MCLLGKIILVSEAQGTVSHITQDPCHPLKSQFEDTTVSKGLIIGTCPESEHTHTHTHTHTHAVHVRISAKASTGELLMNVQQESQRSRLAPQLGWWCTPNHYSVGLVEAGGSGIQSHA